MELQFNKTVCPCLHKVICQVQTQEETQEVRLSDAMPDIGRILGCWGQVLIRGKEWRSGGMTVSGGVMAWVLYAPEDGSAPQSLDTWIPFQMKWDFPDTQRDGIIRVRPYLKGMDCRSISARKLMIRSGISVMGEAMEPVEMDVFLPASVPEDLQLLRQTYPVELPQEAGEKPFQMEDEVALPGNVPPVKQIIRYEMQPQVTEQKVMAGKLVFRGTCGVHMLYASEDGELHTWEYELPFSQLTDLDREYGPNATADISIVPTGMEIETDDEGKLHVKCGLSAQYMIYDRSMIEVVEDAYSTQRALKVHEDALKLPVRLDVRKEAIPFRQTVKAEGNKIVDAAVFWGHPTVRQTGDAAEAEISMQLQVLYRDDNGVLQGGAGKGEEKWSIASDRENQLQLQMGDAWPQSKFTAEGIELTGDIALSASVFSEKGIPMITALELGEMQEPDPGRPSLILRRVGESRLWDLAKECGSTVEAICTVNQLQQEPLADQMLLIPVS